MFTFLIILFLFAYSSVDSSSMPSQSQIDSATKLGQCRAHCIDAFVDQFSKKIDPKSDSNTMLIGQCLGNSDCWMCWEYCDMFQKDFEHFGNLCQQKMICFDGCRLACAVYATVDASNPYHRDWSFPSAPKLEIDTVEGWLRLEWPHIVPLSTIIPPLPHVLYIIFWHPDSNKPWLQLEQTLSTRYETRHGDIVISGLEAEFLILAMTKDGLVASAKPIDNRRTTISNTSVVIPTEIVMVETIDDQGKAKNQLILAIVGCSLLTGLLVLIGLYILKRMIQNQRRRTLVRRNALRIRFRAPSTRNRHVSGSSQLALIGNLNPVTIIETNIQPKIDPPSELIRKSSVSNGYIKDLFKGTMFESPSPYNNNRFNFDFNFNV